MAANTSTKDHLKDRWVKCLSVGGNIRGIVIQATDLVNEINQQHEYTGKQAQAMGEVIVSALLLGSYCKPGERINLQIQSSSDMMKAFADATPEGEVRGFVRQRTEDETLSKEGDGEVRGPWGDGMLTVLRAFSDPELNHHPFQGTVPLATGHLAKDLTFYWVQSEQIPTAVGIKVALDSQQEHVTSVGGFMVQVLGGANEEEIKLVESQINNLDSFSFNMQPNADPKTLLTKLFQDLSFQVVEEKPLHFKCTCSQDRVESALMLLSEDDIQETIRERSGDLEIQCDLCSKHYKIPVERIKKITQVNQF